MSTVFIDVDTQNDFVLPAGALYVPGAEHILPAVARLNQHAGKYGHPIISTVDAHAEDDPEFRRFPAHCIAGTIGQQKPGVTLISPAQNTSKSAQYLLEKTVFDAFSNPNLPLLLDSLQATRCVVYGVVTEICVRCVLWGALARTGLRVELVTDATRSLDEGTAATMMREFVAAGGILTPSSACYA